MDFKSRIQGKNFVMDKSGVHGIVKRQANPINKSQGLYMMDPSEQKEKKQEEHSIVDNASNISSKMFNPKFINLFQSPKPKEEEWEEPIPQKDFHPKTNVPDKAYKELKKKEKEGRSKFMLSTPKDEILKRIETEKEHLTGPRLMHRGLPDLINPTPMTAPFYLQESSANHLSQGLQNHHHYSTSYDTYSQPFSQPYSQPYPQPYPQPYSQPYSQPHPQPYSQPTNPNVFLSPDFQETLKSLYIATNQFPLPNNRGANSLNATANGPSSMGNFNENLPYHPYSIVYDYKYQPPRVLRVNHNNHEEHMENQIKNNRNYQDLEFDNRLQGVNESYLKKFKLESQREFQKMSEIKEEPKKYVHLIDEYAEKNQDIMKKFEYIETLKRLKGI